MTESIQRDEVTSRFQDDHIIAQGLTRLDDEALRHLLVGHELRDLSSVTPQEWFRTDGQRQDQGCFGCTSNSYEIVGDAVCVRYTEGWGCFRIYRNEEGALFRKWEKRETLVPIEMHA